MWNILSEITKREHGLLKRQFNNGCCGSNFMLEHLEFKYHEAPSIEVNENIKFNHNGDLFTFFDANGGYIWDTVERKEKFRIRLNDVDDFRIFNLFGFLQEPTDVVIARGNDIQIKRLEYDNYKETLQKITLDEQDKGKATLALSQKDVAQIYCNIENGRLYHIDVRCDPIIFRGFHHGFDGQNILEHDPIKNELCLAGAKSCVRIFDVRNFHKPLKEYNLESSKRLTACSYNFDGSQILATDVTDSAEGRAHLIFNDNTAQKFSTYDIGFKCKPSFFGPKSEFLVYFQDNKSQGTGELVFKKKLNTHGNIIEKVLEVPFLPCSGSKLLTHSKKSLIVSYMDNSPYPVAFIVPQGSCAKYDHTCDEYCNCDIWRLVFCHGDSSDSDY